MTRRRVLLLLIAAACRPDGSAGGVPDAGLTYPPLPSGVEEIGGMLLTDSTGQELGVSEMQRGERHMIWLSALTSHDSAGNPNWLLLDAVEVPSLRSAESVVWSDCALDGVRDQAVVAVGTWAARDSLTGIRYAWRANLETRRIDTLSVSRVACWAAEDRI